MAYRIQHHPELRDRIREMSKGEKILKKFPDRVLEPKDKLAISLTTLFKTHKQVEVEALLNHGRVDRENLEAVVHVATKQNPAEVLGILRDIDQTELILSKRTGRKITSNDVKAVLLDSMQRDRKSAIEDLVRRHRGY